MAALSSLQIWMTIKQFPCSCSSAPLSSWTSPWCRCTCGPPSPAAAPSSGPLSSASPGRVATARRPQPWRGCFPRRKRRPKRHRRRRTPRRRRVKSNGSLWFTSVSNWTQPEHEAAAQRYSGCGCVIMFILIRIFVALGNKRQEDCMLLFFFYIFISKWKVENTVILVHTKNVSVDWLFIELCHFDDQLMLVYDDWTLPHLRGFAALFHGALLHF